MKAREQDRRKFSTPPIDSLWWRADIGKEDVRWVKQHLGCFLEGAASFELIPKSVWLTEGPLDPDWKNRVCFYEGETAPRIQISLGDKYDYRHEYRRARRERDPHLSPHGLFRRLENGRHEHAMQFMEQFGPLTWDVQTGRRGEEGWVKLSDFWDRHARFVGVVQLWEAISDDVALKNAWRWVHQRLDQINRVGPAKLGSMRSFGGDKYLGYPGVFPWERSWAFEEELESLSGRLLREETFQLLQYELNLHTEECRQIWLMKSTGMRGDEVLFEPTRGFSSLWGAIWDLFGQDISTLRHGWRLCLECGRLFYPKDRRSVCCTSEHQSLWSKRRWARENRKSRFSGKAPKIGTKH